MQRVHCKEGTDLLPWGGVKLSGGITIIGGPVIVCVNFIMPCAEISPVDWGATIIIEIKNETEMTNIDFIKELFFWPILLSIQSLRGDYFYLQVNMTSGLL